MSNACFSWLHLTDLHYGLKGQDCLWPNLRQPFLDDLEKLHDRCGPWHAVLFTGDLVQSGAPEQFTRMQQEFLSPLWERLQQLGSGDAKLLAVPGNHDLIRPDPTSDSPAADTLVRPDRFADVADRFWSDPAGSYRAVIDEAFAGYLEWWAGVPQRPQGLTCGTLPGDFATTLTIAGRHIGIIGLNTAFLQLAGGDYKERLVWSVQQLHALFPDGIDRWLPMHDQCLLLTHHGPGNSRPTCSVICTRPRSNTAGWAAATGRCDSYRAAPSSAWRSTAIHPKSTGRMGTAPAGCCSTMMARR
jgi:hypothetical protein